MRHLKYAARIRELEAQIAKTDHNLMEVNNHVQQLERAVSVLAGSNSNWPMAVGDSDEILIAGRLKVIERPNSEGD